MLGYPSELAFSIFGQPYWVDRLPNINTSGLTESEIKALDTFWRSTRPKTRVTPSRAATKRLCFFSMCKTKARQYADQALITFRPTEVFANKVVDRFEDALFTLPVVAEARKEHVNKIRKLGGVILANVAILNMSWQGFLRAQYVVELDDLD